MVFDSSAILAMLNNEPGADEAFARLDENATLSVVNAGEILGKMVSRGADPAIALASLKNICGRWAAPSEEQARRVGELGVVRDLSLADRFCIALGEAMDEPIVTADRDWRRVPIRVAVEFIR
jgi:PIN domain nuclease of toxin-antitoxin system